MRETVIDGKTGWICKSPDDFVAAIKKVKKEGISEQMRQDCREHVLNNFTVPHMIENYDKLINEAISIGGW